MFKSWVEEWECSWTSESEGVRAFGGRPAPNQTLIEKRFPSPHLPLPHILMAPGSCCFLIALIKREIHVLCYLYMLVLLSCPWLCCVMEPCNFICKPFISNFWLKGFVSYWQNSINQNVGTKRVEFCFGEVVGNFVKCPCSQLSVLRACPQPYLSTWSGRRMKRTN